jgi:hypothetical protein
MQANATEINDSSLIFSKTLKHDASWCRNGAKPVAQTTHLPGAAPLSCDLVVAGISAMIGN